MGWKAIINWNDFRYQLVMRGIIFIAVFTTVQLLSLSSQAQLKDYKIGPKGDTLNAVDQLGRRQGKWANHYDEVRGEPGFEEEGMYKDGRKEGVWRIYSLMGDLTGIEQYKWGNKNGACQYYGINGTVLREENWVALNPNKIYDTIAVEDPDHPEHYRMVVIKNEGIGIKDGVWKYYDPITGMVARTETYDLGKMQKSQTAQRPIDSTQAVAKPKEVLDFEKKTGKKKVKVQDGSVH